LGYPDRNSPPPTEIHFIGLSNITKSCYEGLNRPPRCTDALKTASQAFRIQNHSITGLPAGATRGYADKHVAFIKWKLLMRVLAQFEGIKYLKNTNVHGFFPLGLTIW